MKVHGAYTVFEELSVYTTGWKSERANADIFKNHISFSDQWTVACGSYCWEHFIGLLIA